MSRILNEGGVTQSAKFCDRFEWTVNDFFDKSIGTYVESPGFVYDYAVWHLALGSKEKSSSPNVFLNLWRTKSSGTSRYLVSVGVKSKTGRDCEIVSYETDTDGFLEVRKFLPWVEKTPTNNSKLIPGGRLTVFCELGPSAKGKETPKLANTATNLLKRNLKDLLLNGVNSDVEMKVATKTFKAHKAILSARCTVFASMFHHDMQESNSGVVDIPDCSPDAFSIFLNYLYTGEVDDCISEWVCNLYYIADKYDVQELKEHCVRLLKINLSVENFCDVVALSLRHSENELLQTSCSFFTDNVKLIIKTVRWQKYLKENPAHANELFIKAVNAE